jgi:hypothetical protein
MHRGRHNLVFKKKKKTPAYQSKGADLLVSSQVITKKEFLKNRT